MIRILSPDDYGLVAMAGVYISFITLFSELGLNSSVILLNRVNQYATYGNMAEPRLSTLAKFREECYGPTNRTAIHAPNTRVRVSKGRGGVPYQGICRKSE